MTADEARFRLLVGLSWALRQERRTSTVVVPYMGETVLYVSFPQRPGRRLAVGAAQYMGGWLFTWGRDGQANADRIDQAARTIARQVAS
ncbi:MAG TPA: hypothetical protein VF069_07605 [Streptosporangiaceae bacterium]